MTSLTRFVLRHKRLVTVFWVLVTIIAASTASEAVNSLSQDTRVPGEGAETSQAILQTYGNGGAGIAPGSGRAPAGGDDG